MRVFLESQVDRIELGTSASSQFVNGSATSGFGISSKVPRLTRGAGDGATYRGGRSDTRSVDLDVFFSAADRPAMEVLFRRLTAIVLPRSGWALPRIVVEFPDGSAFESEFVYQSGLEGDASLRESWAKYVISVECPNPFWVSRDAAQFSVTADATGTPFLNDLSGLPVTSSSVLGQVSVTNLGDVPADLTVVLTGPSSGSTTILVNGVGYVFTAALGAGEVVTVARGPLGVTVTDATGANRYAALAAAPKFPQLAPGMNTINVTMVGATAASRISGNYKARFEGVY
jgi:hypothetical protein